MYRILLECAKAVAGFTAAGAGAIATASTDGDITGNEWVWIAITSLGAGAAVFGVTNSQQGERKP